MPGNNRVNDPSNTNAHDIADSKMVIQEQETLFGTNNTNITVNSSVGMDFMKGTPYAQYDQTFYFSYRDKAPEDLAGTKNIVKAPESDDSTQAAVQGKVTSTAYIKPYAGTNFLQPGSVLPGSRSPLYAGVEAGWDKDTEATGCTISVKGVAEVGGYVSRAVGTAYINCDAPVHEDGTTGMKKDITAGGGWSNDHAHGIYNKGAYIKGELSQNFKNSNFGVFAGAAAGADYNGAAFAARGGVHYTRDTAFGNVELRAGVRAQFGQNKTDIFEGGMRPGDPDGALNLGQGSVTPVVGARFTF